MNDIKFEAKNDYAVDQFWKPSLCLQVPIAVAKFSDLVRLLTAAS